MKPKPSTLLLLLAAALIAALLGWMISRAQHNATGGKSSAAVARPDSVAAPVAIEDGKTIDFSSGKPVVKNSPEEKAIIAAAVKEMDAASKDVSFGPTTPPADEKKKAESTGIPPKP